MGNGFQIYADALNERLPMLATCQPEQQPHARAMLALAAPAWERGDYCPAAALYPLYLRNKVALTSAERAAKCQ